MKSKLLDNFGLKILALLFAIILWLLVMNVSDYAVTNQIDDIPVIQLNGDALSELDQIYDVTKGNTVDIIIKGRRSIVEGLDAEDFVATADLSTMSITNTVQIFVEPKNKSLKDEISITYVDNTMSLVLEDKITAQFPVAVKVLGTAAEKYAVCGTIPTPNLITVEGPKTSVSKIKKAEIEVNVDGKDKSFVSEGKVVLYDAYDEEINNDKLIVSDEKVTLKVDIYPIKTVPVEVSFEGAPAEGYLVSEILFQPQTVDIAAAPEVIKDVKKINIDGISVDGIRNNFEQTFDISNYLPEGVTLAQANEDIAVTIVVEKAVSKTLTPKVSDISLLNRDEDFVYDIKPVDNFSIVVTGLEKKLNAINEQNINLKIDCSNLYYGMYEDVAVTMYQQDDVIYEINGAINVEVSNKEKSVADKVAKEE